MGILLYWKVATRVSGLIRLFWLDDKIENTSWDVFLFGSLSFQIEGYKIFVKGQWIKSKFSRIWYEIRFLWLICVRNVFFLSLRKILTWKMFFFMANLYKKLISINVQEYLWRNTFLWYSFVYIRDLQYCSLSSVKSKPSMNS